MDTLRILLVEDNPTDALLLKETFSDIPGFCYELIHRECLEDGLAVVQSENISVILLDLGLPGSSGMDTFRYWHEHVPNIPVLVLTALDDIDVGLQALSEGAQDYIIKKAVQPMELGRAIRYAIERQELLLELQDSRDRLRMLALREQVTLEEERTRISREVHDELGQKLTALKMDLRWLSDRLAKSFAGEQPVLIRARIHESEDLLVDLIEAVQRLAVELRPSALDHLGLIDAIRGESRRFTANSGIPIQLDLPDNLKIRDNELATTFFRIFQELITNVIRHAQATCVKVRFAEVQYDFVLEVIDDGIGMPPEVIRRKTSLGILGMHERAAAHHGHIEFSSGNGQGTHVTVSIPNPSSLEALSS